MTRMKYSSLALLVTIILATACTPKPQPTLPATTIAQNTNQPAATYTPYPTHTPYPTYTPLPTYTPFPTTVPTHTPAPTIPPTATEVVLPTAKPTQPPAAQAQPVAAPEASAQEASAAPSLNLERIPDTDPGPPFTIGVDDVRIAGNGYYRVTGWMRNDGAEIYEHVGVHGSFRDDKGTGYGPIDVYCRSQFLEPGAQCPFSLEIFPKDYVAYHLHPLGQPVVYRQPANASLSGLNLFNDAIGNLRATGTATNGNPFAIKDLVVTIVLFDASGRILNVGSTRVLASIAPGASVSFDLRIKREAYSTYRLYAQGTRK